jgi:hypothetical protein
MYLDSLLRRPLSAYKPRRSPSVRSGGRGWPLAGQARSLNFGRACGAPDEGTARPVVHAMRRLVVDRGEQMLGRCPPDVF